MEKLNNNGRRKLTDQNARDIRSLIWDEGLPMREIAETYNVSIQVIFQIKIELTYKNA